MCVCVRACVRACVPLCVCVCVCVCVFIFSMFENMIITPNGIFWSLLEMRTVYVVLRRSNYLYKNVVSGIMASVAQVLAGMCRWTNRGRIEKGWRASIGIGWGAGGE